MHTRNEQLAELLSLTTQGFSQLTEALVTFSLELMATDDPAARIASRRMAARVSAIQSAFDQQWRLLNLANADTSCLPGALVDADRPPSPAPGTAPGGKER
jgi:hypothetical protein